MYLKTIVVENVGPISNLHIELPFQDGQPRPVVLVGPNGSGKSTVLSFIVNALVGFKQQVFEETEIEQNKVYRVRSRLYVRGGTHWYHAKLEFEDGFSLDEWVLDRPKERFENEINPLPTEGGWKQIGPSGYDCFSLLPVWQRQFQSIPPKLEKLFSNNVVLFFPSDRFELPDWLNERSLASDLKFPEPLPFKGQTSRRIFARALLKPTLEWLKAVVLDSRLSDFVPIPFNVGNTSTMQGLYHKGGRDSQIVELVSAILARVSGADSDHIQLMFNHRNTGTISVAFTRLSRNEIVPNLLGLSAGQAALFCLFCNIIRDFDLAGAQFTQLANIRGIVIIDEADLHLHIDLQYRVLPELIKQFPKVQFIVTAHSPLFVMGMENTFGASGFRVIELPSGSEIESETFSEFEHAFDAFVQTRSFDQRLFDRIQNAAKPVVLVEGKSDVAHLQVAWEKLHPGVVMPFDVEPCGGGMGVKVGRGSARMLKLMLETFCLRFDRPVVLGLFDHDREGMEQFLGLEAAGFASGTDETHRKHQMSSVHAALLPVPVGREKFVSPKATACFLTIEHYYSDALLKKFGVADDPVVADSAVFGIKSDSTKKTRFADEVKSLDKSEFANFKALFDRFAQLFGTQIADLSAPPAKMDHLAEQVVCATGFTPNTVIVDNVESASPDSANSSNHAPSTE